MQDLTGQLPAAVLGNGSLLATIDSHGRIRGVWAPSPDRVLDVDGAADAFLVDADDGADWTQEYVDGAQILRTSARTDGGELVIEDVVHDTKPALLRRVSRPDGRVRVVSIPPGIDEPFDAVAARRRRLDAERLAGAEPPLQQTVTSLYERSLLVFDALSDVRGGVIAAPECDPRFEHSGGYGFVWARDLAYCVLAFLAAGRRDLAERALRWLPRAQESSGLWLQRHWTNGFVAPSWCTHQLDETGSVLFAYETAWRALHDEELDDELWPSARKAAEFLLTEIDDRDLPSETADLWEERDGRHSYTAAAFVGGLRAAAALARRHEPALAATYLEAAGRVAAALDAWFWSDKHNRYLRSLDDPTVDVSLLGLAWPFRAVDARSERMRATAAAVVRVLARPGGGVLRYEQDRYAGGNPWILAALWLGLYRRAVEDDVGHSTAIAYTERVATPLGLLAEQVTEDGRPAWVLPLAWSHALYVLAVRPELDFVASHEGAAASPVRVTP